MEKNIFNKLRRVSVGMTVLIVTSLITVFYTCYKLIDNSQWVNHTNDILLVTENIYSDIKEAESNQRGYLLTKNTSMRNEFELKIEKVPANIQLLENLTADNKNQSDKINNLKGLFIKRKGQMFSMVRKFEMSNFESVEKYSIHLLEGNDVSNEIRNTIAEIRNSEQVLMKSRMKEQVRYMNILPIFLSFAAIIIIIILIFAYQTIKKEFEGRRLLQEKIWSNLEKTKTRIQLIQSTTTAISNGDYSIRVPSDETTDELGNISAAINEMIETIEQNSINDKINNWTQTGIISITNSLNGEANIESFTHKFLYELALYTNASIGTLYLKINQQSYALKSKFNIENAPELIKEKQGLIGQAIQLKQTIEIEEVPADYFNIHSSVGTITPATIVIIPIQYNGNVMAVLELAFIKKPERHVIDFLQRFTDEIAINFESILNLVKLKELLEETQAQSEELQSQHSELENLNSELEAQANKLQTSEEELRVQQEELMQSNGELEERSTLLEDKNREIEIKNSELELSTKYKSEFLANMSHELRTPLNSILLLSRLLSDNNSGNLTGDQVEYASVILNSGNGLLGLIDEILDLSKIEAGKMSLELEEVNVEAIISDMNSLFSPVAKEKKIDLIFEVKPDAPSLIKTDKMRLEQVLKNLISNSLKFTSTGSITMKIDKAEEKGIFFISVKDTGIGIEPSKQKLIFEAFQQADGSTKRKYGGTGLGLSISRELVKLLNGRIELKSEINKGSEFIIYLPINEISTDIITRINNISKSTTPIHLKSQVLNSAKNEVNQYVTNFIPETIPDDRAIINPEDQCILIIEDDINFAKSLIEYTRNKGYKVIYTVRGDEGIELAKKFNPMGILLDVQLPIKSGWDVMDELKAHPTTRRIPVHMMSSLQVKKESISKGAIDFIEKPFAFDQLKEIFSKIEKVINNKSNKVLILEDNPKHAKALSYFLETFNIHSELKSDIKNAINTLNSEEVDCVILDMGIPDEMAYNMLDEIKKNPGMENLPIIIFTGKSLSMNEELKIKKYADSIVVKTAHSYQRMLDEVSLFLHLMEDRKQESNASTLFKGNQKIGALADVLTNKTVLIADDDVRNIFSLTKALESYNMNVISAIDGVEAMEKLNQHEAIDIVLLDMMMPKMDGYETAQKIRNHSNYKNIPIIAVTAKAMTGDREKCIQAGASDYITKPVDIDQLISLLRVWLYEI